MNLVERTNEIVGDDKRTLMALGILFMVIRLSLNAERFTAVQTAIPDVDVWVKQSVSGTAARTGEVLAITDPSSVLKRLTSLGLDDSQIHSLGSIVTETLADVLDRDTLDTLTLRIPLLAGAPA